jgi:ornithine cyclodeaminase/alanine dehydrogenase
VTRFYDGDFLERHLSYEIALRAMEVCFDAEADGTTRLPPRIDTPSGRGFFRVMPAVLDDVMGCKIMTLVEGSGTRYLVMLYDVATGGLLALFDADELTRIRTAAVTALAGNAMLAEPPREFALIGSGFEAEGHIRLMAHVWPLERVIVYSPNAERRARFAERMTAAIGIPVVAAESEADALRDRALVVLATKSKTPVLDGRNLAAGAVVLSIGSTRLDLRELDDHSLARASIVVADDPQNVLHESADIAQTIAAGILDPKRMIALSALRRGGRPERGDGGDVAIFKSVGTALQDLALARMLYRDDAMRTAALELPELTRLKPFAGKPVPTPTPA